MFRENNSPIEKRARHISYKQQKPWFICRRGGCSDVMVSEQDITRYMKIGYEPLCAFYRGVRYDTLYMVDGKVCFVMSEEGLKALSDAADPSQSAA